MEINWIKDSTETLSKNAELWDLTRTNTELNKQFEQTTKKPRGAGRGGGGGGGKKTTSDSVLIFLPNTSWSLYSLYVFIKKKPNYLVRCLVAFRSGSGFFRLKR